MHPGVEKYGRESYLLIKMWELARASYESRIRWSVVYVVCSVPLWRLFTLCVRRAVEADILPVAATARASGGKINSAVRSVIQNFLTDSC